MEWGGMDRLVEGRIIRSPFCWFFCFPGRSSARLHHHHHRLAAAVPHAVMRLSPIPIAVRPAFSSRCAMTLWELRECILMKIE
jgi:hypothetical protein